MIARSHKEWLTQYLEDKTATWVIIKTLCGKSYYFKEYQDWYEVQRQLEDCQQVVKEVHLQYRSNVIKESLEDYEGVYIIRSVLGSPGQESIHTMTIGKIKDEIVDKTIWIIKGLVEENKYCDSLNNCFEEAIYTWNRK